MAIDLSELLDDVDTAPDVIHESELADLLGITANRVRTLTRDGVLKRCDRARYSRREAVRAYCRHLREVAARGGRSGPASDEFKAERTRLAKEQADATALKNATARSELVSADAVLAEWSGILRDVRAAMLAVPSRHGAKHPHMTPHDIAALDREIRAALEGLANGDY